MDIQVAPGKRAGSSLFHCNDGYHYHLNKGVQEGNSAVFYLRCINFDSRGCTGGARIYFFQGGNLEWVNGKQHTCPPNPTHHLVLNLRREILQESINQFGPYETPAQVVNRVREVKFHAQQHILPLIK